MQSVYAPGTFPKAAPLYSIQWTRKKTRLYWNGNIIFNYLCFSSLWIKMLLISDSTSYFVKAEAHTEILILSLLDYNHKAMASVESLPISPS